MLGSGVEQRPARRAHNPEDAGSNPASATAFSSFPSFPAAARRGPAGAGAPAVPAFGPDSRLQFCGGA